MRKWNLRIKDTINKISFYVDFPIDLIHFLTSAKKAGPNIHCNNNYYTHLQGPWWGKTKTIVKCVWEGEGGCSTKQPPPLGEVMTINNNAYQIKM